MQSTREIKRRINSVNNTKQITRAMQMVAAAKLRGAQNRVENNRPYEEKMRNTIFRVLNQAKLVSHPLIETPKSEAPTVYVVFSADRGLCGGYNVNVVKEARRHIDNSSKECKIIAVGKYARDFFRKRNYDVIMEYVDIDDEPSFDRAKQISEAVEQMFRDEVVGEVYITFSKFKNAMTQMPLTRKLLPMSRETFSEGESEEKSGKNDNQAEADNQENPADAAGLDDQIYKFEPSAEEVLGGIMYSYMKSSIFRALLEAKASEQGARMTAMKNATDNADDMIDELTLTYNKARQGAITQEILEIVSGAEALK